MTASERLLQRPLWILVGQMGVVFAVFVGFGAAGVLRPKIVIAALTCLLVGTIALGPVRRVNQLVVTAPVVAITFWWLASYLWTFNVFGWWTDTQQNLPYVIACVVLIGLLPNESFRAALVAGCYLAIAYTVFQLLIHPATATVNPDGVAGWRGGFVHKNEMGPFMLVAVLALVSFDRPGRRRTVGIVVACALALAARSTTALGAALVTLIVVAMLRRLARSDRKARASIVVTSIFAVAVGWLLYSTVVPALLGLSGKDSTLTGRTEIWSGVWGKINDRPWQGYGIGGVWSDPSAEPARSILQGLGFTVFHSHNGYLEVLLLLGAVGLAILSWLMASLVRLALADLRRDTAASLFEIGFVLLMAILSITEVAVFGIWLGLLCALQTSAAREAYRRRSGRGAALAGGVARGHLRGVGSAAGRH